MSWKWYQKMHQHEKVKKSKLISKDASARKSEKIKIAKTRIKPTAHADIYDDLHMFDPAFIAWTFINQNVSGTAPSSRGFHGFTAALGRLYVHGGKNEKGDVCRGGWGWEGDGVSRLSKNLPCVWQSTFPQRLSRLHSGVGGVGCLYVYGGNDVCGDCGGLEGDGVSRLFASGISRRKQLHAMRGIAERIVSLHPWHESGDASGVVSNRDPLHPLLLLPHAKSILLQPPPHSLRVQMRKPHPPPVRRASSPFSSSPIMHVIGLRAWRRHPRRPARLRPRRHDVDKPLRWRVRHRTFRQIRSRLHGGGGPSLRARGRGEYWWVSDTVKRVGSWVGVGGGDQAPGAEHAAAARVLICNKVNTLGLIIV